VPSEMVLPAFVAAVLFVALLIAYPWQILPVGSVVYLLSLPIGWKSYRDQERSFVSRTEAGEELKADQGTGRFPAAGTHPGSDERPTHLN